MTDTVCVSRAPAQLAEPPAEPLDQQADQIHDLAQGLAAEAGCALHDVTWRGGTLVVSASALGGGSPDIDSLGQLSRRLSAALDAADLVQGRYVLEVSSPGLERKLTRPEHFAGAVGERAVLTSSGPERRRIVGEVLSADASTVSIRVEQAERAGETVTVPLESISKARTVFEWGARPNPSQRKQR